MKKTLGIFVSSNNHLDTLIRLCGKAQEMGVSVTIFLSHQGILLTQEERFRELVRLAHISLCHSGLLNIGLTPSIQGIQEKDYATQARHGEILDACDRYLVF